MMAVSSDVSIVLCTLTAFLYVSSLYIGTFLFGARKGGSRDSPAVVRRRFAGVTFACALALLIVHTARQAGQPKLTIGTTLWMALGLRFDDWVAASLYPLLLTAVLFLGPLLMWALETSARSIPTVAGGAEGDETSSQKGPVVKKSRWHRLGREALAHASDILMWRNLVVAPITEEFVFRACIGELLRLGGFSTKSVILICPVFFAVAHLHHFWELVYYQRQPVELAVLSLVLQMTYTTLFGWYAAFLLWRTGHLLSPIVAHIFCNIMGFPDLGAVPRHTHRKVISVAFILGLAAFILLVRDSTILDWSFGSDVRGTD